MIHEYGYGNWILVMINIAFFSMFLVFIPFRKKMTRLPSSMYLAFIVAFYSEMYGFPLTIYILSWFFGYQNPLTHTAGHLLAGVIGEDVFFYVIHPLSTILMIVGILLIVFSWKKIYGSKGQLVTDGIYAYVRHPQYLGILILSLGMIVQWITIPTVFMWPFLVILYYRLAKKEQKEMEEKFGEKYRQYRIKVPMFLPLKR